MQQTEVKNNNYFINNAIYGMTSGQMAPTTLLGQLRQPPPGEDQRSDYPINMSECWRRSGRRVVKDSCMILKTLKMPKAIKAQVQQAVWFSIVEVLSAVHQLKLIRQVVEMDREMIPQYLLAILGKDLEV